MKKTNRLLTVEEGWITSGIGAEISAAIMEHAFDYLDAPIVRICQSDTPYAFATTLIEEATPQIKEIVEAVKTVTYIK